MFFCMNGIENYPAAGENFLENVILKVSQTQFSKDFYRKGGINFSRGGCEVPCLSYPLYSVDCTLRKRQRIEKAPQQIPLRTDEVSADPILQDAKRAYYESGTAYFEEARWYYAKLNEDIKKYDKRMVLDSLYAA